MANVGNGPVTLGLSPSFGFGDRIGLATPGHVASMNLAGAGIDPIFPQQSIREMNRTGRSARQVMADALNGMERAGWTGKTGADADHLKTKEDVDVTVDAGFTFFTIDPSDFVDSRADGYDEWKLREKCASLTHQIGWLDDYRGRAVGLDTGTKIEFDEQACMRALVKYGNAVEHACNLSNYIARRNEEAGNDFEIELSVDETEHPTTLAEHYIIADQCLSRGMRLVSLAPRFIGDFEKGIDFKGDGKALERSLRDHAAIAELLGPYKLSLHSGSDKISMYTVLAKTTKSRFHVKTAGTSYLEALRVVARHDHSLFRRIIDFGRARYNTDKATYHVSATLDTVPPQTEVSTAAELERVYLENWDDVEPGKGFRNPGRQILHCTFGSVLTNPELAQSIRTILHENLITYTDVLSNHFARHLDALTAGM